MPLSQTDMQKVRDHFQASGVHAGCHACGVTNWIVGDELVAIPRVSLDGVTLPGGKMVPMVQAVCARCGYVMHFAAMTVGLIP
jgi:hypothetical protein